MEFILASTVMGPKKRTKRQSPFTEPAPIFFEKGRLRGGVPKRSQFRWSSMEEIRTQLLKRLKEANALCNPNALKDLLVGCWLGFAEVEGKGLVCLPCVLRNPRNAHLYQRWSGSLSRHMERVHNKIRGVNDVDVVLGSYRTQGGNWKTSAALSLEKKPLSQSISYEDVEDGLHILWKAIDASLQKQST